MNIDLTNSEEMEYKTDVILQNFCQFSGIILKYQPSISKHNCELM